MKPLKVTLAPFIFSLMFLFLPTRSEALVDIPPGVFFEGTVFEVKDGKVIAPLAKHLPAPPPNNAGWFDTGWTPYEDGDYISYEAGEILTRGQGTLVVDFVLLGEDDNPLLTHRYVEALVTLYDGKEKAFFSVGINNTDLVVGSFPIHPMLMEDAFGGASFPYLSKLEGPLKGGTEIKVTVTWGPNPMDDRIYVNGKYLDLDSRRGPRGRGKPPGYKPTVSFASYLNGFEGFTGGPVGPPETLVIGRIGTDRSMNMMASPRSVAIKSLRLSGRVEVP